MAGFLTLISRLLTCLAPLEATVHAHGPDLQRWGANEVGAVL
jgi:hypothetical protein